jgi:hypothetical protein
MAARTGANGASFEARPEEGRAPQDDGSVCGGCEKPPVGLRGKVWDRHAA